MVTQEEYVEATRRAEHLARTEAQVVEVRFDAAAGQSATSSIPGSSFG